MCHPGHQSAHSGLQPDSPCRFIPHAIIRCSRALDQRHGPPRKQGLRPHAIADRPATLTPSISPKLGASSQHQELHRCALWRIFRPAFRREGSTRILRHLLFHDDYTTIGGQNKKTSKSAISCFSLICQVTILCAPDIRRSLLISLCHMAIVREPQVIPPSVR